MTALFKSVGLVAALARFVPCGLGSQFASSGLWLRLERFQRMSRFGVAPNKTNQREAQSLVFCQEVLPAKASSVQVVFANKVGF